jgi:cold shock CspA family protein
MESENGSDVHVHLSFKQDSGFKSQIEDEAVRFDVQTGPKCQSAANVKTA